jgi:hypothetical protein
MAETVLAGGARLGEGRSEMEAACLATPRIPAEKMWGAICASEHGIPGRWDPHLLVLPLCEKQKSPLRRKLELLRASRAPCLPSKWLRSRKRQAWVGNRTHGSGEGLACGREGHQGENGTQGHRSLFDSGTVEPAPGFSLNLFFFCIGHAARLFVCLFIGTYSFYYLFKLNTC